VKIEKNNDITRYVFKDTSMRSEVKLIPQANGGILFSVWGRRRCDCGKGDVCENARFFVKSVELKKMIDVLKKVK